MDCAQDLLYTDPPPLKHSMLVTAIVYEHRYWQADSEQVALSDESSFNLWDHHFHIRLNA